MAEYGKECCKPMEKRDGQLNGRDLSRFREGLERHDFVPGFRVFSNDRENRII